MMTKETAIKIHWMMYYECYELGGNITKKVDKWMKQIKKGMRNIKDDVRKPIVHDVHNTLVRVKKEILPKDENTVVEFNELLMTLYNAIPEKYQEIFYKDKTFTSVVESFGGCISDIEEDISHTKWGRKIANALLDDLGVERSSKLTTRKNIIKGNLILEGKYVS